MDSNIYKNPGKDLRIYKLVHSIPDDFDKHMDSLEADGFGGVVINAEWHRDEDKPGKYLCEKEDFENLDERISALKKRGFGIWLYDEKGYPSATADGLTLEGHPEYEAKGFTFIKTDGKDFEIGDDFEKIIYACKNDGSEVEYDEKRAVGADICYVVRSVFEGSHAEKCGFGPRRYPNLLDKAAIGAFIKCTYDNYHDNLKNFDEFEAVFTDEPSLMSAYVNCPNRMDYVFLPWQDDLPQVFLEMHGKDFFSVITELFDTSDTFSSEKLMYWQTVSEMVNDAYFVQIADWCNKHNVVFSGHNLLEECIGMHVPLYGNLVKCLKSFGFPGVDMLTGSPEAFRIDRNFQFGMAAKYVGSVARMTGKTKKVMVEICPLTNWVHDGEYTFGQQIGTMDLLFMCGINHINSYLSPERLKGRFKEYADYFGRVAYIMRESRWVGQIGLYYPIENMQGFYHPDYLGINTGASLSATEQRIQDTMIDFYINIHSANKDFTVIDGEWIKEADIVNGALSLNGLEITHLVMPGVSYVDSEVLDKLCEFENKGGTVIWEKTKPDGVEAEICENAVLALKDCVGYGITVEADEITNIMVSPVTKNGKRIWYVINSSAQINNIKILLNDGVEFDILSNADGEVYKASSFELQPYTSVFVVER